MEGQLTLIGILLLIQLAVISIVWGFVRRVPHHHLGQRDRRGELFWLNALESTATDSRQPEVMGYFFVDPECPVCEDVLSEWRHVAHTEFIPTALVGVGNKSTVLERYGAMAEDLGWPLFACAQPRTIGVSQVPWLIVVDSQSRITHYHSAANVQRVKRTLSGAFEWTPMA